jgi:hypothetical protein
MVSRPLITELPACGPSRGGNHPKTLRGPVGKERPAGPCSHIRERNALNRVVRRSSLVNRSVGSAGVTEKVAMASIGGTGLADSRRRHCRRRAPSELYYPGYEFIFVHERDTFY